MPNNKPGTSNHHSTNTLPDVFSGEVSLDIFLRNYWQKKPLLIRNAFPGLTSPISAEELAGLACEEDVNARIVIEKDGSSPWQVQYGPFDDDSFTILPETHWTLLVNDVEKYVPEAKALFDQFRFIPDWRKDDLMISYAVDGGSVGPHLDAYDVFLIQIEGKRNWKISYQHCNRFIEDIELKILSGFDADEDWILEPGDMLYLPPNIAHYGIAVGSCMTASVGFRAPSVRAMVSEYAEFVANHISEALRYGDPDIRQQANPAEIDKSALIKIKDILGQKLTIDDNTLAQWFGEYLTDARSSNQLSEVSKSINNFETLKKNLLSQGEFQQSPFSRFIFTRSENGALLFVDGQSYQTNINLAENLCQNHTLNSSDIFSLALTEHDKAALLSLYNRGCIN